MVDSHVSAVQKISDKAKDNKQQHNSVDGEREKITTSISSNDVPNARSELGARAMGMVDHSARDTQFEIIVRDMEQNADNRRQVECRNSCSGRRSEVFTSLPIHLLASDTRSVLRTVEDAGGTDGPQLGARPDVDDVAARTESHLDRKRTRDSDGLHIISHHFGKSGLGTCISSNVCLSRRTALRRNVPVGTTYGSANSEEVVSGTISADTTRISVRRFTHREGEQDRQIGPRSSEIRRSCSPRRQPIEISDTADKSIYNNNTRDFYEKKQVDSRFSENASSSGSDAEALHRSQLQGRECESSQHVDTRQPSTTIRDAFSSKTQRRRRPNQISDVRVFSTRSEDQHHAEQTSIRCGNIPAEDDIPRCVSSSHCEFPAYLMRIIEGRHRGAIKGQRRKIDVSWPSHCPAVDTCDFTQILKAATPATAERITLLVNKLSANGIAASKLTTDACHSSIVSRKTLKQMIRAKVICEAGEGAKVNTLVFLVPEPSKLRNRIIAWPIWANQREDQWYEWDHSVAWQADICQIVEADILSASYGACFDLKASFYQVELSSQQSQAFVFSVAGKKYQWTRMPMGYTTSAEIMQLLTQTVAELSVKGTNVQWRVHVDNILFSSNSKEQVQIAINNAVQIALDFGLTYSEIPAEPAKKVLFHGVYIDFEQKSIAMAEKAREKLAQFEEFLKHREAAKSSHIIDFEIRSGVCPLLRILATAAFWSRTMFRSSNFTIGSMSDRYPTMQLIRAVARADFRGLFSFPCNRGALTQLRDWLRHIPTKVHPPVFSQEYYELTTDACNTGGGFNLSKKNDKLAAPLRRLAWPWRYPAESKDMGKMELRAIAIAVANCGLTDSSIIINTDSTIAIGALDKGYSPSAAINREVQRIFQICKTKRLLIKCRYVNTKENTADDLSRAVTKCINNSSNRQIRLPTTWVWENIKYAFRQDKDEGCDLFVEVSDNLIDDISPNGERLALSPNPSALW